MTHPKQKKIKISTIQWRTARK